MSADGASPPRGVWRDPVLSLIVAVLLGLIVPYALPGLDPRSVYLFGENVGMPLLLVAALVAILWDVRALRAEAERRFWYLVAIGLGFSMLLDHPAERPALHQLHGVVPVALVLSHRVSPSDVGVVETARSLGFALEALDGLGGLGEGRRQEF